MNQLPLRMARGEDAEFLISVSKAKAAGGGPFDLTGCQVWFVIKRAENDPDDEAISICSTLNDKAEITSPEGGLFIASLAAADTAGLDLTEELRAVWEVQILTSAGKRRKPRRGQIVIELDVIRATS